MSEEEYYKWCNDALIGLLCRYTNDECIIILEWMDMIKARKENDLVGDERYKGVLACINIELEHLDMYSSMMWRAWYYAPFILRQH
jgi:hypothetical protein